MREQHPDAEALARFAVGELTRVEMIEIERHLAVCFDCRDRAGEAAAPMSFPLLDGLYAEYDKVFERAVLGAAEQLAGLRREARSAEDLLAELLCGPMAGRQRKIRDDERFHSLQLCQLLRTHSKECWFSAPSAARDLAELAVGVAEHLDSRRYGAMLTEDARTLSWAYLGNALRITSDFWRAERALQRAWVHHRQGSGDLDTECELLKLTSSLRINQNRFDEAARITNQVIALYRAGRDHHREGAALIKKGLALGHQGHYGEAIPVIRSGLSRINAAQEPLLLRAGKHNLCFCLFESGEHENAGRLIEELRPLYQESADGTLLARFRWLEGQLATHLGRFKEAEARLREARDFFLDWKIGADVVLVSIDLAGVHARAGQRRQVREVLDEVIPLAEALGLRQETLMARLLYEQASRL
jgi:tetratricopeptide (TPR) repeat protein